MKTKEDYIKELSQKTDGYLTMKEAELVRGVLSGYAKEQSIAFAEWKYANRWFTYENGYWCYTFEQATAVSDKTYNKLYRKTSEELYQLFLQSQSTNH